MTLSPDLGIARCCARKPNNAVDGQLAGLIIKGFQRRQVGFRRCGDAARGAKVPAEFFGWEEEAETCRFSGSLRVDRFASYMFLAVALRLAFHPRSAQYRRARRKQILITRGPGERSIRARSVTLWTGRNLRWQNLRASSPPASHDRARFCHGK